MEIFNTKFFKFVSRTNNKIIAFTLAEVLIVIGIIGIIAQITIPTLIQDVQTAQFVSGWKKTYSVLQQAQLSMIKDYGSVSAALGVMAFDAAGGNNFRDGWLPYLKVAKSCDSGTTVSAGCYNVPDGFKNLDNSAIANYATHPFDSSIVLQDGSTLIFFPAGAGNSVSTDAFIFVDVNGDKPPNTMGKDVYVLRYSSFKNMFQAHNATAAGAYYPACAGDGWTCGAYYLYTK